MWSMGARMGCSIYSNIGCWVVPSLRYAKVEYAVSSSHVSRISFLRLQEKSGLSLKSLRTLEIVLLVLSSGRDCIT